RLDELKRVKVIPGADAFKLYDTYGFPIDLTQLIAAERRQTVDVAGFERELGKQRTRSQEALERSKGGGGPAVHRQRAGEGRRWTSRGAGISSAIIPGPTLCTPRCGRSSAPTCGSRARSWRRTGCGSTSRTTARSTT